MTVTCCWVNMGPKKLKIGGELQSCPICMDPIMITHADQHYHDYWTCPTIQCSARVHTRCYKKYRHRNANRCALCTVDIGLTDPIDPANFYSDPETPDSDTDDDSDYSDPETPDSDTDEDSNTRGKRKRTTSKPKVKAAVAPSTCKTPHIKQPITDSDDDNDQSGPGLSQPQHTYQHNNLTTTSK